MADFVTCQNTQYVPNFLFRLFRPSRLVYMRTRIWWGGWWGDSAYTNIYSDTQPAVSGEYIKLIRHARTINIYNQQSIKYNYRHYSRKKKHTHTSVSIWILLIASPKNVCVISVCSLRKLFVDLSKMMVGYGAHKKVKMRGDF